MRYVLTCKECKEVSVATFVLYEDSRLKGLCDKCKQAEVKSILKALGVTYADDGQRNCRTGEKRAQ